MPKKLRRLPPRNMSNQDARWYVGTVNVSAHAWRGNRAVELPGAALQEAVTLVAARDGGYVRGIR